MYLLNTTQSAIQDIAAQCGINDVNYFTKLFKKLKNMTPTQYREMVQHK
ncbi:MAG: helix-turn-helix domain-containing protein [Lachnospira sp.]